VVNTTVTEKFLNSRIVVLYVGSILEMYTVILQWKSELQQFLPYAYMYELDL
jgi:hypothetical protein